MNGPTKAGVRKQLAAMVSAYQPGASSQVGAAGLAGNYSPAALRAAVAGYGMDPSLGAALPRDPRLFLSAMDPGLPPTPAALDRGGPGGRPLPRISQYPIAWNLPGAPGTYKMVPFRLLRNLGDQYDILRRCIEVRKQEIADIDWEIAPKEERRGEFRVMPGKRDGLIDQHRDARKALQAFFERPDPILGLDWQSWVKLAIEEVMVVDALSIFEHPTWGDHAGVAGSDLFALTILDGTTIKPLLDVRGAPPAPPAPAFQQYIWGLPRADLVSLVMDARDDPTIADAQRGFTYSKAEYMEWTADQLAYMPYVKRNWTPYGFSNVEQIIMTINLALKRQQWHLARFTAGDIPALLIPVPDTWDANQVITYEAKWHAMLAGDPEWAHRAKMVPSKGGGVGAQELKPPVHQMDFDHFLLYMTCAGTDVDPTEIGFPPPGGLGGAGYMQGTADRRERLTVKPMMRVLKRYVDSVIQRRVPGAAALEIRFENLEAEDEELQHKIDTERLSRATLSPNEYRERRGEPRIDDKNADRYYFAMTREVIGLDQVGTTNMDDQQQAQLEAKQQQPVAQPGQSPQPNQPAQPVQAQKAAEPDDEAPARSLEDEIRAFERYTSKGDRRRAFRSDVLPKAAINKVYAALAAGRDRRELFADLRRSVIEGREMLAAEVADALLDSFAATPSSRL